MGNKRDYKIEKTLGDKKIELPRVDYLPRDPKKYRPRIGLIACGGITSYHLTAYKKAGYDVVALCDVHEEKARARQKEYYPKAQVFTDYREIINRDDIDVLDVATHPDHRFEIIKSALDAGKHVLSQKPFVTDLAQGEKLVELAEKRGVKLAVNQNGRWAPHFSYMRNAIKRGMIGTVIAAHMEVHWDHNWVKGTPFENVRHIVLYDFGIHWFDMLNCFMRGQTPLRVYASNAVSPAQKIKPPLLGQVMVEYENAQATIVLDADVRFGREDRSYVAGTRGTLLSTGPSLEKQTVTLSTARGFGSPDLQGSWFENGFHGTMAELLLAIEQKREPENSAADNLRSLALCFAACRSAETGKPVKPGSVKRLH